MLVCLRRNLSRRTEGGFRSSTYLSGMELRHVMRTMSMLLQSWGQNITAIRPSHLLHAEVCRRAGVPRQSSVRPTRCLLCGRSLPHWWPRGSSSTACLWPTSCPSPRGRWSEAVCWPQSLLVWHCLLNLAEYLLLKIRNTLLPLCVSADWNMT